jgi:cytochrome P450
MMETNVHLMLDEAFIQDAHAVATRMRETAPVRLVKLPNGFPVWLVTGYEQARAAAMDPRLSSQGVYDRLFSLQMGGAELSPDEFAMDLSHSLLNLDPPDHTRLRKLVAKTFTSSSIESLRPRIELIADELLDAMAGQETVELLEAYGYPLPIRVICEMLGIPYEDHPRFMEWSKTMVAAATPQEVGGVSRQMARYVNELVEEKRERPSGDLLSRLLEVSTEDGERLSRAELVATAIVLLIGGFETTVNLISSGVLALLEHPDQLALLRADPRLLPAAVEEFLRYETPNNLSSPRFTTEPVVIGGVQIPAGQFVMISWLAANRDGARFPGADRLDVTRVNNPHLAFGHGIHFCVGAALARLEGEIAFGRLIQRFGQISLVGSPAQLRWRSSTSMHGLEALRVRLR